MYGEDCSTCEHFFICPTQYIDQQTNGCSDWEGWHHLKVNCPYEPDVDQEVTIVISCGGSVQFDQAFLQEDGCWHTKTGKKYDCGPESPVLAWRVLKFDGKSQIGS